MCLHPREKRDQKAPAHITTPLEIDLRSVALCAYFASKFRNELHYSYPSEMQHCCSSDECISRQNSTLPIAQSMLPYTGSSSICQSMIDTAPQLMYAVLGDLPAAERLMSPSSSGQKSTDQLASGTLLVLKQVIFTLAALRTL